jgi:hypothetical protein
MNIAYCNRLKGHEREKGTDNEKITMKWRSPIMRRGGNNDLDLRSLAIEDSLRVQNTLGSVRIPILPPCLIISKTERLREGILDLNVFHYLLQLKFQTFFFPINIS